MFVVFEGIDGSGKTTVSNRVVERLLARGLTVKHVRAEGKFASTVTESIRALARDARNVALVPKAEFLLYVAREVQLMEEALLPALESHDVVIADRFLYTAEVLARYGRGLKHNLVDAVLSELGADLTPDLNILVDVDPALARARRRVQKQSARETKPPSRKGLAGAGLQQRLRHGYARLASATTERWAVVDNDAALETTVERVTDLITSALERGAWRSLVEFRDRATTRERESAPSSAAQASAAFLRWVEQRAEREPGVAAFFLGGFFGPGVDELRLSLAERAPAALLASAQGLADEVSFRLRERLAPSEPRAVAASLAGLPNTELRALALRQALAPRATADVLASLTGLGDDTTFELFARHYESFPEVVVEALAGLDDARAWAIRERWLGERRGQLDSSYELARSALRSLRGLGDERAWAIRKAMRAVAPAEAIRSLTRLADEQSFRWRREALARAPRPVMESLRGVAVAQAWALRAAVARDCREALEGFAGAGSDEAWLLREQYADVWPCAVVRSLGTRADTARGIELLQRQLTLHGHNLNVQRHATAISLGVQRDSALGESD
jgi:dTMP kinase